MAADTTAAASASASNPPPLPTAELSPSSISSPLTEVEDKDGEPDEMDLDEPENDVASHDDDDDSNSRVAPPSHLETDNDDESALSEIEPDLNDSEAETERLYDTPLKNRNIEDSRAADAESSPESTAASPTRRVAQTRSDRIFQASPSKLKQQLQVESDADVDADLRARDDEKALSVAQDEENNEADGEEEAIAENRSPVASRSHRRQPPSSKDLQTAAAKRALHSQSPISAMTATSKLTERAASADTDKTDKDLHTPSATLRSQRSTTADIRKRKRSPTTDPSESDQPLRKRLGSSSGGVSGSVLACDGKAAVNEDGDKVKAANGKRPNGNGAGEETTVDNVNGDKTDQTTETPGEGGVDGDMFRVRRSKRSSAKKRSNSDGEEEANDTNDASDTHDVNDSNEGLNENGAEDGDAATAEEDAAGHGEDEPIDGDVDEEAGALLRNEEEMERKRIALENLQAIEKQFASFRDRLYQERLDQLNQEEAMLASDNPTHPEYLAMMQCVNERRNEKLRVIDIEYQLNMQTLKRWAVARRSQIHGQYFQSVRESRELVLEELGRQWYQIQQQRRRYANTIPDFGLRFPTSKIQQTREAITYNKEVSILSGVAKYEGFPAAPQINGASSAQVEDDLEAIARGRQVISQAPQILPVNGQAMLHHQQQQQYQLTSQPQQHQHQHQLQMASAALYPEQQAPPGINTGGGIPSSTHLYANGGAAGRSNGGSGGSSSGSGGSAPTVSFHNIGAAGQQFLAETPWANPKHPAHRPSLSSLPVPLSHPSF